MDGTPVWQKTARKRGDNQKGVIRITDAKTLEFAANGSNKEYFAQWKDLRVIPIVLFFLCYIENLYRVQREIPFWVHCTVYMYVIFRIQRI